MKNNSIATLAAALSVAALLIAPGLSSAQTPAAQPAADAKAGAEAAKPAKAAPTTSRRASAPAKGAADAALSPAQLAIAERVHVGQMPCELGSSITLSADPKTPGYFHMQGKSFGYRMAPVVSSTGTIRLEDAKAGTVWLQMATKSMLMNQKQGSRLADGCMSPAQQAAAQAQAAKEQQEAAAPAAPASASTK